MSKLIAEKLLAGVIFGDTANGEYIYLPGGEVGADKPLCVLERPQGSEDLPLDLAAAMIGRLALKPCSHPFFGRRSF